MPSVSTSKSRKEDLAFLKRIILVCPETGEPQKIVDVVGDDGEFVIFTRGKSHGWKHIITSEEL